MRRKPVRTRRDKTKDGGRGWLESVLFAVMGPAQIGDVHAPSSYQPTAADLACPRCAAPWVDHEVVRTQYTTISHCPKPGT